MRKNGIHINCAQCGEEFYISNSRIGKTKYCSMDCKKRHASFLSTHINCEYCNSEFKVYKHELPRKKFCNSNCRDKFNAVRRSIEMKTYICEICTGEFDRKPVKGKINKYCSIQCRNISYENRVSVSCDYCFSELTRPLSHTNERNFCSMICRGKYASENLIGEKSYVFNSIKTNCENCNKSFLQPKSRIDSGKGKFCSKDCAYEHLSGENCHFWNGGISAIRSYLRDHIGTWKKMSMESSNYKCIITHGAFDDIHHLKSFESIVKETFKELCYSIKNSLSDYTDEELKNIKNKCVELHRKYPLGVCLRRDIHIIFHKIYGKINNTPEQFEEFRVRYSSGEFNEIIHSVAS